MGKKKRVRSMFNRAIKEARRKGHHMRESLEDAIKKVNEEKKPRGWRVQILLDPLMKTAWFVDVEGAGFPTKQEAMERTLEDLKSDDRFTEEDIAKFRKELEEEMER